MDENPSLVLKGKEFTFDGAFILSSSENSKPFSLNLHSLVNQKVRGKLELHSGVSSPLASIRINEFDMTLKDVKNHNKMKNSSPPLLSSSLASLALLAISETGGSEKANAENKMKILPSSSSLSYCTSEKNRIKSKGE